MVVNFSCELRFCKIILEGDALQICRCWEKVGVIGASLAILLKSREFRTICRIGRFTMLGGISLCEF
jgi:hypothetical protein